MEERGIVRSAAPVRAERSRRGTGGAGVYGRSGRNNFLCQSEPADAGGQPSDFGPLGERRRSGGDRLRQALSSPRELDSDLASLRIDLNASKSQLELLVGGEITGDVTLGLLPQVTDAELEDMKLKKDLKTAKGNSRDLHQAVQAYMDVRKGCNDHSGDSGLSCKANNRSYQQARHNCYAAKYTYDKTVQDFALDLRNLYLKALDYQQLRQAAQAALSEELENCAARMKYS